MLTVYGRNNSFNVQKVLWFVEELGVECRHVPLGRLVRRNRHAGVPRQKIPTAKVPLIEDGEDIVWESHAILRYLADRYGRPDFWSDDPGARATADQWMEWCQCQIMQHFVDGVFWGFYRTPEAERDASRVAASIERSNELYGVLDRFIADKRYLLGDGLSLADIAIGATLYRYFNVGIPRPAMPNLERWYAALQARFRIPRPRHAAVRRSPRTPRLLTGGQRHSRAGCRQR